MLFFPERCSHCGQCESACTHGVHHVSRNIHELTREGCVHCGQCIDACSLSRRSCSSGVLVLPTRENSVAELWTLLKPQLAVLRDAGGITVSGGEPLLQSQAVSELLRLCKTVGYPTAVETSGAVSRDHLTDILDLVDCWLYGYRPTAFYIPRESHSIEENLAFLAGTGARIIIRTPIIPGITEGLDSLGRITKTMLALGLREIELLPFNPGTSHYYSALGKTCPVRNIQQPSAGQMAAVQDYLKRAGLSARVLNW